MFIFNVITASHQNPQPSGENSLSIPTQQKNNLNMVPP